MNFYNEMKARLGENGLFDNQAEEIMQLAIKDDRLDNMNGRWSDDVSGYPSPLVNITFVLVRMVAYDWICKNAPMAWFRAAFSPGIAGLEGQELDDYIEKYMSEKQGMTKKG